MNIKALLCAALLLGLGSQARCSTNISLIVGAGVTNASFTVGTGQVAKVVYAALNSANLWVTAAGVSNIVYSYAQATYYVVTLPLPVVVGPATVTLASNNTGTGTGICTIEVSNPCDSLVPSTAVVIPADSGGPVNIILESSTDLVTWTAALPGSYGTSTQKRFFRVRAERTQ